MACQGLFIGAYDDLVRLRPDVKHEYGVPKRQPQSFPLANGVMNDSLMPPHHRSVGKHKIPRQDPGPGIGFYIRSIVSIRHKADVLAVWLIRHVKADFPCQLANLIFRIFSYWHKGPFQLFLG